MPEKSNDTMSEDAKEKIKLIVQWAKVWANGDEGKKRLQDAQEKAESAALNIRKARKIKPERLTVEVESLAEKTDVRQVDDHCRDCYYWKYLQSCMERDTTDYFNYTKWKETTHGTT